MADEIVSTSLESPILPEPIPPVVPPAEPDDVNSLLAELEKAGVTNADQLQGKLAASREAGNMANQLGDTRKRVAELEGLLASQPPEDSFDYDGSADIRKVLREEIEANDNRKMKAQVEAQNQIRALWGEIQNDEDYPLVKDIWEAKLQDPNFIFQLQNGQVNPSREYTNIVRGFYKGSAKKSADAIKALQSGGMPEPPHVEGGNQGVPPKAAGEATASQKRMDELTDKVNKGGLLTQEEELDALLASLTD